MEIDKTGVKYKSVMITMSDGKMISGFVNIQHTNRVSDFLNIDGKQFIVLLKQISNEPIMINKNFIMKVETNE